MTSLPSALPSSSSAAPLAPALPPPGQGEMQVICADKPFRADEVSVARAVGELLQVVRESLALEVVFIGQISGGRRYFRHVSTALAPAPIAEGGSHPAEESICQRLLDGRVPALIPSVREIAQAQQFTPEVCALSSHIGVPVYLPDGRLYGTLCGFNLREGSALDERDVKRLEVAASAAARLLAQADGSTQALDVALA